MIQYQHFNFFSLFTWRDICQGNSLGVAWVPPTIFSPRGCVCSAFNNNGSRGNTDLPIKWMTSQQPFCIHSKEYSTMKNDVLFSFCLPAAHERRQQARIRTFMLKTNESLRNNSSPTHRNCMHTGAAMTTLWTHSRFFLKLFLSPFHLTLSSFILIDLVPQSCSNVHVTFNTRCYRAQSCETPN